MKRFLLSVLCLFLPFTAFASDSLYNGFYIGPQASMVYGYFSQNANSSMTGIGSFPAPVDDHASNLGGDVGLHLGYGHVFFQNYYVGGELNGDLQAVHVESHSLSTNTAAVGYATNTFSGRLSNAYGFDLRAGYLVTPSILLYLKGGVQGSYLDASSTTAYGSAAPVDVTVTAGNEGEVLGWQTGFGIEKHTQGNWGFRAEDLFTVYQAMNATASQTSGARTATVTTTIKPFTNQLMVEASYYFW